MLDFHVRLGYLFQLIISLRPTAAYIIIDYLIVIGPVQTLCPRVEYRHRPVVKLTWHILNAMCPAYVVNITLTTSMHTHVYVMINLNTRTSTFM